MPRWLMAIVLSVVFNISLSAKFVAIECVSGDCNIPLYADDTDFLKTLSSEEKPNITFALDVKPLIIEEDFNSSFKISAYEINVSGKKEMLASSDLLIPSDLTGKELMFKMRLDPFIGGKTIFFAVHRSDGSLLAVYKGVYSFNGSLPEQEISSNNNDLLTPKISCGDDGFNDCNLDSLFFNKIQFEESPSNSFRVRKSVGGIYKIGIPINRSERINTFSLNPRKPRSTKTENDKSEDNFDPEKILQLGRLGLGLSMPKALLEIVGTRDDLVPLKFNESNLTTQPLEGSFEFSNGELYFTRRGQRNHVVLSPFSSNIVIPAPVQSPMSLLAKVLESDTSGNGLKMTGGHDVTFTSIGLSSLTLPTSGTVATLADIIPVNTNVTALQSSVTALQSSAALAEARKLLDTNLINSMTLTGANDVALTTTGPTALTLPTTGVVATIADVVFAAVGAVPNNSITSIKIVDGAIIDADISATANIAGSKLANTSVTLGKMAANSVDSSKIVDASVASIDITDGTIIDADISATANINGSKLLNGSVTAAKLASNIIVSASITDGTVASVDITDGTIIDTDISATANIAGSKLANTSVTLAKIAANSVDSSKIVDASIVDADIAVAANINGSKLLNASVSLAKMAADSVDSSKIVNASITGADIAAATITPDKLQTIQINTVSTNYTVTATDLAKVLEVTAAAPITITLPAGLGAGFYVDVANISGAAITLIPAGGTTLVSRGRFQNVSTQYGTARLRTRTNTAWMASGDLN
jgi:hypothetical protein